MVGVCPQDDILWDSLTAVEHMYLVASFKGLQRGPNLDQAVVAVLEQVKLEDRKNDFASAYSGGMKRRLSVALSTVGDVDILFFDEPTTGLDPISRRRVWDTIQRVKRGRVVILTTHNMEEVSSNGHYSILSVSYFLLSGALELQLCSSSIISHNITSIAHNHHTNIPLPLLKQRKQADFLGDQIMVLHGGRVKAVGDSLSLKNRFGPGYQVSMLLQQQEVRVDRTGQDRKEMGARIRST